jgi:transcriptional regulator with XRE-family HTH domain
MLRKKMDQSGLADMLGISVNTAHRYLYGDRQPPLALIVRIERDFKIPCASWTEKPSQEFRPPGAMRSAA